MTEKQKKALLFAQQGELDAVLMYRSLSKAAKLKKDKETFLRLASEGGITPPFSISSQAKS